MLIINDSTVWIIVMMIQQTKKAKPDVLFLRVCVCEMRCPVRSLHISEKRCPDSDSCHNFAGSSLTLSLYLSLFFSVSLSLTLSLCIYLSFSLCPSLTLSHSLSLSLFQSLSLSFYLSLSLFYSHTPFISISLTYFRNLIMLPEYKKRK